MKPQWGRRAKKWRTVKKQRRIEADLQGRLLGITKFKFGIVEQRRFAFVGKSNYKVVTVESTLEFSELIAKGMQFSICKVAIGLRTYTSAILLV